MDPESPQAASETTTDKSGSERSGHWKRASISAAFWWLAAVAAILAGGDVEGSESIGYVAGTLLVPFALAAGITGFLAKRSSRSWGWGKHLSVTLAAGIVLAVASAIGKLAG